MIVLLTSNLLLDAQFESHQDDMAPDLSWPWSKLGPNN